MLLTCMECKKGFDGSLDNYPICESCKEKEKIFIYEKYKRGMWCMPIEERLERIEKFIFDLESGRRELIVKGR